MTIGNILGHLKNHAALHVDQEVKTVEVETLDGGTEVFPVHYRDGCWTLNPQARGRFQTEVMDLFRVLPGA